MTDLSIVVLGGTGMLGHKVFQKLRTSITQTWCVSRRTAVETCSLAPGLLNDDRVIYGVDLSNFVSIEAVLSQIRPNVVINCVGVIKQRAQATEAVPSIEINSLLPHRLAAICSKWGGRLIHFSTDCVFSGLRGNYSEDDLPDARDLYGRSKCLGEILEAPNAITLRTSMIGRELTQFHSLLEWFLAQEGKEITGYTRAIYSGVTTNYLASMLVGLIRDFPRLSGLYQISAKPISKYDLLCRLRELYQCDIGIVPDDKFFCDRSMSGQKFEKTTGYGTPSWRALIEELANDKTPYSTWRKAADKRQPDFTLCGDPHIGE